MSPNDTIAHDASGTGTYENGIQLMNMVWNYADSEAERSALWFLFHGSFISVSYDSDDFGRTGRGNIGKTGNAFANLTRAQKRNLETLENIVDKHLTDMDFSGTLRDLEGDPVPKPGGGYWNHLQEMQDSYKGLKKIKKGLEGSLKNPQLDSATRRVLQDGLNKTNSYIKKIEQLFKPFGGI
jgi:hypothetical protein